jgi:hypothetical protein
MEKQAEERIISSAIRPPKAKGINVRLFER